MSAKYNLFNGTDSQCYFNLMAGNHEIILQSEGYTTREGAENGIRSVQKNSQIDERYERKIAKNNEPYFVLKAGNGQIIGVSETYSSKQAMERGIASVKRNGSTTSIKDWKEKRIKIILNGEKYQIGIQTMTGREILSLGDFDANKYCLTKTTDGSEVSPDQVVTLKKGMEFHAILKDIKFG